MDVDLIARCRTHDRSAFAGLVDLWNEQALKVALRATNGDQPAALGAVRDGLIRAWRELPSTHSQRPLRPWLLGIISRTAAGPGDPSDANIGAIVRARGDAQADAAIRALLDQAPAVHLGGAFYEDEIAPRLGDVAAIEVRRLVGGSPAEVWETIVDPASVGAWSGVDGARIRPNGPLQRGSRITGRGRLAERRSASIEILVTRAETASVFAWAARARLASLPRAIELHRVIDLVPRAEGCEVRARLLGVAFPPGVAGRALHAAYRRVEPGMHASMLHDVERLATLIERRAHKA
ncbi:MAG: hypothetical protein ABR552_02610 [Actinomycetota bacterium]